MAFIRTNIRREFSGFGLGPYSWEMDVVGMGLWRITSPALGVLNIWIAYPIPLETGFVGEGIPHADVTYENAPRGGSVGIDQFVTTETWPATKGKLKMTHGDPSNLRFIYVYDLDFEQKKTLIGTVYDPNSDTKLPFSAYYVGPPGTQLPMVLAYVTTEPRVLPYTRIAPLLPVPQTIPPETPVAPPSIVTKQIVATGQQTTVLLPTPSSIAAAQILGTTVAAVVSTQPFISAKQSVVELKPTSELLPQPQQPTVSNPEISLGVASSQAGLLGGLSPTLVLLLAGGAALFLFTGKKENGKKEKRKERE